jgi:integrase
MEQSASTGTSPRDAGQVGQGQDALFQRYVNRGQIDEPGLGVLALLAGVLRPAAGGTVNVSFSVAVHVHGAGSENAIRSPSPDLGSVGGLARYDAGMSPAILTPPQDAAGRDGTEAIRDQLERWQADLLRVGGVSADSLKKRAGRIRTVFDAEGWGAAASPTREGIVGHITKLRSAGREVKTVETLLGQLGAFFDWCVEQGIRTDNPCFGIKRAKKRRGSALSKRKGMRSLSSAEAARLIAAARADEAGPEPRFSKPRSPIYVLAASTGGRAGQICRGLRWRDVDVDGPAPHLVYDADEAKNGASWRIPLTPEAAAELRAWRGRCEVAGPDDEVFPWEWQERWFDADLKAAGIPKKGGVCGRPAGLHSLRKTFCTNLVVSGVAPGVAQKLMQHKCIEMTMRVYAEVRDEQLAAGVSGLPSIADFSGADKPCTGGELRRSEGEVQPPFVKKGVDSRGGSAEDVVLTVPTMHAATLQLDRPSTPVFGAGAAVGRENPAVLPPATEAGVGGAPDLAGLLGRIDPPVAGPGGLTGQCRGADSNRPSPWGASGDGRGGPDAAAASLTITWNGSVHDIADLIRRLGLDGGGRR